MTIEELITVFRNFYRDLKESDEKYKAIKKRKEEEKKKTTRRSVLLN